MIGKRNQIGIGVALLVAGVLVACQSEATPTLAELDEPGISVGITDDSCPTVQVKAGQLINWTNQGTQEHIVRAQSIESETTFDSGTTKPGDNFAITLSQPDVFEYQCSVDGVLTGTITIEP
jgi:plastocyanin